MTRASHAHPRTHATCATAVACRTRASCLLRCKQACVGGGGLGAGPHLYPLHHLQIPCTCLLTHATLGAMAWCGL